MRVYKIKSGFTCGEVNGKRLEYFADGWKKTTKFELVDELDYAESWWEATEIYNKYGFEVAATCSEYLIAGCLKNNYLRAYIQIREKMADRGIPPEDMKKAFELCPIFYFLALTGVGSFDVIRLDEIIGTPDGVSTKTHLQQLYGEGVAKAIEAGI